jgi:hypothetical protein
VNLNDVFGQVYANSSNVAHGIFLPKWLQVDLPITRILALQSHGPEVGSPLVFANRRANRMKVLVHDGIGVWLAARRLNIGKFAWANDVVSTLPLSRTQFDALVLGLPWQRLGDAGIIRVI